MIRDAEGSVRLRIDPPEEGRSRLRDAAGTKVGKVKIQADRVKVKDATDTPRAKVKRKESGFKLYDGGETVLLKGKLKGGDDLELEQADGTRIAKLKGPTGDLGGRRVDVRVGDGHFDVLLDGTMVARLEGSTRPEPAALLALPDLDVYQQAALLVFLREVW